jgi:hypothetical protein
MKKDVLLIMLPQELTTFKFGQSFGRKRTFLEKYEIHILQESRALFNAASFLQLAITD